MIIVSQRTFISKSGLRARSDDLYHQCQRNWGLRYYFCCFAINHFLPDREGAKHSLSDLITTNIHEDLKAKPNVEPSREIHVNSSVWCVLPQNSCTIPPRIPPRGCAEKRNPPPGSSISPRGVWFLGKKVPPDGKTPRHITFVPLKYVRTKPFYHHPRPPTIIDILRNALCTHIISHARSCSHHPHHMYAAALFEIKSQLAASKGTMTTDQFKRFWVGGRVFSFRLQLKRKSG